MSETIEVHLEIDGGTRQVGVCRYVSKRGRSASSVFEYDPSWLDDPAAFAIDPTNLPVQRGPFATGNEQSGLPGAIRDGVPDRWGQRLIERAFRKANETRTLTEIDYLLAINDATRVGALRYRREGATEFDERVGEYKVPPMIQLPALLNAADAVHGNTETAEDLKLLLNQGSPLGGARPKSVVQDNQGDLAIAKFPKPDDDRSIAHGEVLALTLAKAAGINAAEAQVESVVGKPVSLIKRFDRRGGTRVPFLSAMSLLNANDGEEAAYTEIADAIRINCAHPTEDLHELWRRIVFSVMIGNLDDHLRNHGFLRLEEGWVLSPAYDLNPVPAEERAREMTTWISEEGPQADVQLALNACEFFALSSSEAQAILDEVASVVQTWREVAQQIGMSGPDQRTYSSSFIT